MYYGSGKASSGVQDPEALTAVPHVDLHFSVLIESIPVQKLVWLP